MPTTSERLRRAAWALTEPSTHVTHPAERRQARLLAAMLLAAVPLGLATTLLTALAQGASATTPAGAATCLTGLGAYALARSRRPQAGSLLVVLLAVWGTWSATAAAGPIGPNDPGLFFLTISILLSSLLLPLGATLAVATGNVAGVLALPALLPWLRIGDVLDPALFLVFVSALIGVFSAVRRRDLRHIEDQARAIGEQEARLRAILDHAPDTIMLLDRAGVIRYANRAVHGAAPEDLVGNALADHVPDEERVRLLGLVQQVFATGRGESYEMRAAEPAGGACWHAGRLAPVVQGGEVVALTLIATDITHLKAAEEERGRSQARAVELARLREEARFRGNFINMAAHELRTPMAPIKTQLYLLKRSRAPRYDAEERMAFELLERNVERLNVLLRDLLDASRIQAGDVGLDARPVDLGEVVVGSAAAFQGPAEQAGIRLTAHVGDGLTVQGDASRLAQVVSSLVGNALKFTPRGGSVSVEARAEDGHAVLRVQDTGDGLTEEQRGLLFQPFGQLRVRADHVAEGAGLGLYLTRDIVERHGGQVRCDSDGPGRGCTFVVELPLRRALPAAP